MSEFDSVSRAVALPARRCPLCGGPNQCVPADRGGFDTPCWCQRVEFSAELLARVPADAYGQSCICRRCATSAQT